jgi:hypothetical protein
MPMVTPLVMAAVDEATRHLIADLILTGAARSGAAAKRLLRRAFHREETEAFSAEERAKQVAKLAVGVREAVVRLGGSEAFAEQVALEVVKAGRGPFP